jgi:hypothetical protein
MGLLRLQISSGEKENEQTMIMTSYFEAFSAPVLHLTKKRKKEDGFVSTYFMAFLSSLQPSVE